MNYMPRRPAEDTDAPGAVPVPTPAKRRKHIDWTNTITWSGGVIGGVAAYFGLLKLIFWFIKH